MISRKSEVMVDEVTDFSKWAGGVLESAITAYSAFGPVASSRSIVQSVVDRMPDEALLVTTSLSDAVLTKVMAMIGLPHRLVFIDTGYHFAETMEYLDVMCEVAAVPIEQVQAQESILEHEARLGSTPYLTTPDECCSRRKVRPLEPLLRSSANWVTGVRRADGGTRALATAVLEDRHHQLIKVNPLLLWTDADVDRFIAEHDLPQHPLRPLGLMSVGCEPCTTVADATSSRSGRWQGTGKTECGLHREFVPDGGTTGVGVDLLGLGGRMGVGVDELIEGWLLSGCDERITVRPETGANQYHLHPMRYEGLLMRGSCTCGTLTQDGHATARRFAAEYSMRDDQVWVEQQTQRIRKLFGSESGQSFDVFFGPSGSDMMYWPLLMQSILHPGEKIINIVSCPEELGSGSILAAEGKYFAGLNQFGEAVVKGEVVSDRVPVEVKFLPAREVTGRIADRRQQIRDIVAANPGQPIVGNLVFGSKSGIKDDLDIIDEFGDEVMWVVDMCQFRTSTELVRDLLDKGVMMMVTGSKFYQAPPFCGALLVPGMWTERLVPLPADPVADFGRVFSAHDVPAELVGVRALWPGFPNAGLRLRWEIALDEMEAYLAFPREDTEALITRWNRVVVGRLALSDRFKLMPDMELTNDSIISFAVRAGGHELGYDELKTLFDTVVLRRHEGLDGVDRVFFGQPVRYGDRSFIRLAIGSTEVRTMLAEGTFDVANDLLLVDLIESTAVELFGE